MLILKDFEVVENKDCKDCYFNTASISSITCPDFDSKLLCDTGDNPVIFVKKKKEKVNE